MGFREKAKGIARGCLAARARKVSRLVTSIYDEELAPYHLNASRMNLLVAIGLSPGITASRLGSMLAIEKSTMSRNMAALEQAGWIKQSTDGRDHPLELTPEGQSQVELALPGWERAQQRTEVALGTLAEAFMVRYPMPGDP